MKSAGPYLRGLADGDLTGPPASSRRNRASVEQPVSRNRVALADVPSARATNTSLSAQLDRLGWYAELMDDRFRIPATNIRFGLDALLGLLPGIGDTVASLVSAAIVAEAWRMGVPPATLMRMGGNIVLDVVLGSVPLVGDLFDVAWKANRRNLRLVHEHAASNGARTRR